MRVRIPNRLVFATLISLATGGLLAARPYAPRFVLKGRMQDERGHQLIFSGNSKKLLASVKPANTDLEQFQYVFDIPTERIEFALPEEPLPYGVCLSHDGKLLGAITVDDVAVWDLQQRSKVKSVAHVPAPIQRIFFGPGGELLGHNFKVQLWNMETKKLLNLWMEMGRPVGPGLVEFRDDQLVRFVDLVSEKEVGRLKMHFAIADKSRSYAHLDHSLDFRMVAADCRRAWGPNEHACFDTQNGTQFEFSDFRDVYGAAVSPDGQWYAPVVKDYVPKQSHFLGRWLDLIRREEPDRWCLLFFRTAYRRVCRTIARCRARQVFAGWPNTRDHQRRRSLAALGLPIAAALVANHAMVTACRHDRIRLGSSIACMVQEGNCRNYKSEVQIMILAAAARRPTPAAPIQRKE